MLEFLQFLGMVLVGSLLVAGVLIGAMLILGVALQYTVGKFLNL